MTSSGETAFSVPDWGPPWESHTGRYATIYVPAGLGADAERAQAEARQADDILQALRRVLHPSEDDPDESLAIYLIPSGHVPRCDRPSHNGAPSRGRAADSGAVERKSAPEMVRDLDPGAAGEPLARQITRHMVAEWFGSDAAADHVHVEGLAGLAAAHAGAGRSVQDSDRWVDGELAAGRPVAVVTGQRNGHAEPPTEIDAGATSFVAYLASQFGQEALRQYLSAYDASRQDHAATEVYHQPLTLLEEEWLAKRRRHAMTGDVFRPFLRQVIPLLRPYRWKLLEVLVYLLLAAAYNVVQPYAIKVVIDRLTTQVQGGGVADAGAAFAKTLAPLILLLLGVYVLNAVVSLRRAYTVSRLNQDILNTLQIRMYAHLHRLSHSFHVNAKVGDIMARLGDDLDVVQQALSQVTNKALYQSFTVVGALTALVVLTAKSPELAILILLIMPLFAVSYVALRTRNKQASREQRQRVGQTMAAVQESLSAHAVIKAFGMEDRTISDYRTRILALQRSKLRLALLSAMTDLSADLTTALAQLVIIGVGGYLVLRDPYNSLSVGDLAALLVLVKSIFSPIASLSGIGQTMQQATGAMERVAELFDEPVTIQDKPGATDLPVLAREIRFDNVSFSYSSNRTALRRVALTIPAGANVAIVGTTGSGKSTMVNLLLRFWDPDRGRILFDDADLRDVTLASLRAQIGLVFQETFILNTTLRANIAIGRPDATDAEIVAAAEAARLDSFVQSLPAGYDTIPGENGARLSTGQKQRIAIARAFLRNPAIIILDEATSALDAKTEAEILETLSELARGRTTVSVTHRISQASTADLIFVVDAGRVVAQGTHAELVAGGGLYRKLYEEATGFVKSGDRRAAAAPAPREKARRHSARSLPVAP